MRLGHLGKESSRDCRITRPGQKYLVILYINQKFVYPRNCKFEKSKFKNYKINIILKFQIVRRMNDRHKARGAQTAKSCNEFSMFSSHMETIRTEAHLQVEIKMNKQ